MTDWTIKSDSMVSTDRGFLIEILILTWTSLHAWAAFDFIDKYSLASIVAIMVSYFASFSTVQKSERSSVLASEEVLTKL